MSYFNWRAILTGLLLIGGLKFIFSFLQLLICCYSGRFSKTTFYDIVPSDTFFILTGTITNLSNLSFLLAGLFLTFYFPKKIILNSILIGICYSIVVSLINQTDISIFFIQALTCTILVLIGATIGKYINKKKK